MVDRLATARLSNDLGAGVIDQLVALEMLDDMATVLDFRRRALAKSFEALCDAIDRLELPWTVDSVDGGISAWVQLGRPVSSALATAVRAQGLLIGAGPWFGIRGEFERFMRIPITAAPDDINRAIEILAVAWRELPGTKGD